MFRVQNGSHMYEGKMYANCTPTVQMTIYNNGCPPLTLAENLLQ